MNDLKDELPSFRRCTKRFKFRTKKEEYVRLSTWWMYTDWETGAVIFTTTNPRTKRAIKLESPTRLEVKELAAHLEAFGATTVVGT